MYLNKFKKINDATFYLNPALLSLKRKNKKKLHYVVREYNELNKFEHENSTKFKDIVGRRRIARATTQPVPSTAFAAGRREYSPRCFFLFRGISKIKISAAMWLRPSVYRNNYQPYSGSGGNRNTHRKRKNVKKKTSTHTKAQAGILRPAYVISSGGTVQFSSAKLRFKKRTLEGEERGAMVLKQDRNDCDFVFFLTSVYFIFWSGT